MPGMALPPAARRTAPLRLLVLLAIAALAAVPAALSSCGGGGDYATGTSNTATAAAVSIKVGIVQSLSGAGAAYGKSALDGIQLAISQVNAGSVPGVHIDAAVSDDASTPEGAKAAFQAFADARVATILGPTLSNTAPDAHRIAQDAHIPVLASTPTAAGITQVGDEIFRVALAEDVVGAGHPRLCREAAARQARRPHPRQRRRLLAFIRRRDAQRCHYRGRDRQHRN